MLSSKLQKPFPSDVTPRSLKANLFQSPFLVNLTVPNKQFFSVKLLVGLPDQLFNSQTMIKLK